MGVCEDSRDGYVFDEPTTIKDKLRMIEREAGNIFEPAGDVINTVNNILDSKANLEEAINPIQRIKNAWDGMSVEEAKAVLKIGDHIKVMRPAYSHHGIYIGEGKVIEYNEFIVQESLLEDFSNGDKIIFVDEYSPYEKEKIVQRARSRLGERNYNLVWNNCDNFATWCRCGGE
ncbi:lecithin retinol acyltransferase family protein [uncultured Succiniclasticum sp.]|uniref:lecithin retinol acyltransferase family protein n=1 Tax=uncultured Succiniclasticum sp. TaxID=1500547 RepID=UPI0025FAAD3E|nr:lecithin retinol acyltransferase family protein [uncultured Succiniclasticum sp.]